VGARPTRRLSLQPEATGAGMEETKCLKPLVSQAAPGGVQPRGDRLPTAHGLRTGAPSARVRPTTSALSAGRTFIERSHAPLAGNLGGRSSMPAKGPGTTVIRLFGYRCRSVLAGSCPRGPRWPSCAAAACAPSRPCSHGSLLPKGSVRVLPRRLLDQAPSRQEGRAGYPPQD
jgi:hypothetical protein